LAFHEYARDLTRVGDDLTSLKVDVVTTKDDIAASRDNFRANGFAGLPSDVREIFDLFGLDENIKQLIIDNLLNVNIDDIPLSFTQILEGSASTFGKIADIYTGPDEELSAVVEPSQFLIIAGWTIGLIMSSTVLKRYRC
jgi:hypothetical protein